MYDAKYTKDPPWQLAKKTKKKTKKLLNSRLLSVWFGTLFRCFKQVASRPVHKFW